LWASQTDPADYAPGNAAEPVYCPLIHRYVYFFGSSGNIGKHLLTDLSESSQAAADERGFSRGCIIGEGHNCLR
jgi:hypothetical protein